jgi:hypothetical protein
VELVAHQQYQQYQLFFLLEVLAEEGLAVLPVPLPHPAVGAVERLTAARLLEMALAIQVEGVEEVPRPLALLAVVVQASLFFVGTHLKLKSR